MVGMILYRLLDKGTRSQYSRNELTDLLKKAFIGGISEMHGSLVVVLRYPIGIGEWGADV
jgi:hypothetical protein